MLRRMSFVMLGVIGLLWFSTVGAIAATTDPNVIIPNSVTILGFTVDTASAISWLIGTLLPLVVACIVKQSWNSTVKGIIHLTLAAITAVASQAIASIHGNTPFLWQSVVVSALVTFAVGLLAYYGVKISIPAQYIQVNYGIKDALVPAVAAPVHEAEHKPAEGRPAFKVPEE